MSSRGCNQAPHLGDGVEREQLHRLAVGLPHAVHDLPCANEWPLILVHILLVDLVCHQHNVLVVCKLNELTQVVLTEALAWSDWVGGLISQSIRTAGETWVVHRGWEKLTAYGVQGKGTRPGHSKSPVGFPGLMKTRPRTCFPSRRAFLTEALSESMLSAQFFFSSRK